MGRGTIDATEWLQLPQGEARLCDKGKRTTKAARSSLSLSFELSIWTFNCRPTPHILQERVLLCRSSLS